MPRATGEFLYICTLQQTKKKGMQLAYLNLLALARIGQKIYTDPNSPRILFYVSRPKFVSMLDYYDVKTNGFFGIHIASEGFCSEVTPTLEDLHTFTQFATFINK